MNKYSYKKGIKKAVINILIFVGSSAIVALPEIMNMSIVDVIKDNLTKIVGGVSIGAFLTFGINYLKNYNK